ncbi:MAG: winged helix-turn-helix transcriptional regulator [Kiritimatiellae bacterium]|nr:winged helix-turn-helix transcriptional regulator [Kiritimatiellia bacterium]
MGRTDCEIVRKIKDTPSITTSQLAEEMGMSRIGIQRAIARLKARDIIRRVGPDKGGHWEVVEFV